MSAHPRVPPLPVYLTQQLRAVEARAIAQDNPPQLMELAGLAAAELARDRLLDGKRSVLVLAGPGNNGGDGFVLARHLKQWWYQVSVLFTGERSKLPSDARAALDAWRAAGGQILTALPDGSWDLIVDALFGIGLERDVTGAYADLIGFINAQRTTVLAIDIPSGLHADSGRVLGCAVRAAHTVTFIALKAGLLTLDGPDHAGELHLRDLGLDVEALAPTAGSLVATDSVRRVINPRQRNSHKGTFGSVGVLGGDSGMTGAALLAGRSALKLGAGRVYVGLLGEGAPCLDPLQPELMLRRMDEVLALDHLSCLIVGPGLGQSSEAQRCLAAGLKRRLPLVLDADALNLLGVQAASGESCRLRSAPTLITPHPAEAARLLRTDTATVQKDRVAAALSLAARYGAAVALKGAGTVIALPDGHWYINTSGNPGLASAGMGDVLSGILGALIAQGAEPYAALIAGVSLHGRAADDLMETLAGPVGLTASEITDAARRLLNAEIYG